MGGRANFEERYSGPSLQGNYIGGACCPDKTRWGRKNGYPEYFAKALNSASDRGSTCASTARSLIWRSAR